MTTVSKETAQQRLRTEPLSRETRCRSEDYLSAKLQLPVSVCLTCADLPESFRVVDIVAWLAKDRMVEEVEGFSAELELLLAPDGEGANDGGVEIDPPLLLLRIGAPVSIRILCGNRVGCCIEPLRLRMRITMDVAHHVGAFVGPAVSGVGLIGFVEHCEILPIAPGEDIVDLPIAQDVVAEAVSS